MDAARWRQVRRADANAPLLFAAHLDNGAVLVKQNALRRVYRLERADGCYYVKQHLQRGLGRRLRNLLGGNPARGEYRASGYARTHGVPAVDLIACAERLDDWQPHMSASVSVGVAGACELTEAFAQIAALTPDSVRRSARRSLSTALAELLATAHDAAFLHPDGHPGNILVSGGGADGYTCRYVDMQGVRCGREVSDADAARNLAALQQWFAPRTSRAERLRFLKTYAARRKRWTSRAALRGFAALVNRASRRHAQRLYRQRDRRVGRNNAFFACFALPDGRRAVVTLRFRRVGGLDCDVHQRSRAEWQTLLAGQPAQSDLSSPAARIETESFFADRRETALAWRLVGSPAWRRYRTACPAMNRDIPAAYGLACITQAEGWGVARGEWMMATPPNGAALLRFLADAPPAQRRRALADVGRLVAATASRGLALRAPGAARIGVTVGADGVPRAYWVGVEGIGVRAPAGPHVAHWMLAQLSHSVTRLDCLSRADRVRVLRAYCRAADEGNWRVVLGRIREILGLALA